MVTLHLRGNRNAIYSMLLHNPGHASVPADQFCIQSLHRIPKAAKALQDQVQQLTQHRGATATHFPSTSVDGDPTTSLGSLFQSSATSPVKNLFLRSDLNLPWHNLRIFCLIVSLVTWEKRSTPTSPATPPILFL